MKHLPKKIIICLFVVAVFGFHLVADASIAFFSCNGKACCCKKNMQAAMHVSKVHGYSAESGFCAAAERLRCCMKKETWPESKAILVLSPKQSLKDGHGTSPFDVKTLSFFQLNSGLNGTNRFLVKKNPIPIYLKNLMLIC